MRTGTLRVAVIEGDGIGPELVAAALRVLDACAERFGLEVRQVPIPGGAAYWRRTGRNLPEYALETIRSCDALLKGPVGLPDARRADGTEAGLLGGVLRTGLDAYANVRPIRLLGGIESALARTGAGIDYVIVRENTEGLYLSRSAGIVTPHAAADQFMITRPGAERIARFAFETARRRTGAPADGVRRVTLVDKSNVLRSFALLRRIVDEVSGGYPDVELDHRYADAAAHDLVMDPSHFDVVVTENFLGDILSDLGAATVGGLGMCPSANIGDDAAYFEPVHGSAPGIAGTDVANPTSQLLSLALLLEHTGRPEAAESIRAAAQDYFLAHVDALSPSGGLVGGAAAYLAEIVARIAAPGPETKGKTR